VTRLYDDSAQAACRAALSGAPLDPTHPWHGQVSAGTVHATDLTRWHKGRQGSDD